jgi:hypothetical protein
MDYNEQTVQRLAEHLNELAEMNEYGVHVMPLRVTRGVWAFHVTDNVGGDWTTTGTSVGYHKILSWVRSGF